MFRQPWKLLLIPSLVALTSGVLACLPTLVLPNVVICISVLAIGIVFEHGLLTFHAHSQVEGFTFARSQRLYKIVLLVYGAATLFMLLAILRVSLFFIPLVCLLLIFMYEYTARGLESLSGLVARPRPWQWETHFPLYFAGALLIGFCFVGSGHESEWNNLLVYLGLAVVPAQGMTHLLCRKFSPPYVRDAYVEDMFLSFCLALLSVAACIASHQMAYAAVFACFSLRVALSFLIGRYLNV